MPSLRSPLNAAVRQAASSMSIAAAKSTDAPRRSACLAARTPTGEFAAIVAASSNAVSRAWPAGTRRLTRPSRSASSTPTLRPVSTRSAARAGPRRRRMFCVPPPPGTSPSVTSGSPKTAVSSATIRSQDNANSVPPPSAKPNTAATVGCGRFSTPPKAARNASRW